MTQQELFDRVATHLLTQKAKAIGADGRCRYRAPNGLTCAIGCLIPEEQYDPELEGCTVFNTRIREVAGFQMALSDLAADLQRLHDYESPEHWCAELKEVAANHRLNTAALDRMTP